MEDAYPQPLLCLKPDISLTDLYDLSEVGELQSQFTIFTEEDFAAALRQAQAEINRELCAEHVRRVAESRKPRTPARHFRVDHVEASDSQDSKGSSSEEENSETLDEDEESADEDVGDQGYDERPAVVPAERGANAAVEPQQVQPADSQAHPTKTTSQAKSANLKKAIGRTNAAESEAKSAERQRAELSQRLGKAVTVVCRLCGEIMAAGRATAALYSGRVDEAAEAERVSRRGREFDARLARGLYQARQEYLGIKQAVLRSHLRHNHSNPDPARLLQLWRSCCHLLTTCLNYIPLSGGRVFPARFTDLIQQIVDAGSLTSHLSLDLTGLISSLRQIEALHAQLISGEKASTGNSSGNTSTGGGGDHALLRELARQRFGSPQRSPERRGSDSVGVRPIAGKLKGQKTNLARSRQQQEIRQNASASPLKVQFAAEATAEDAADMDAQPSRRYRGVDSPLSDVQHGVEVSQPSTDGRTRGSSMHGPFETTFDGVLQYSKEQDTSGMDREATWSIAQAAGKDGGAIWNEARQARTEAGANWNGARQTSTEQAALSPDLNRILQRIHNLELLAVREDKASITAVQSNNEQPVRTEARHNIHHDRGVLAADYHDRGAPHAADLQLAVQRIEAIEADFKLLHSKYSRKSVTIYEEKSEQEREKEEGPLSKELLAGIEQEILTELLSRELWFS